MAGVYIYPFELLTQNAYSDHTGGGLGPSVKLHLRH